MHEHRLPYPGHTTDAGWRSRPDARRHDVGIDVVPLVRLQQQQYYIHDGCLDTHTEKPE